MNYTAENIVSLSPGRAFREKIGMYLSADRQEAINLGLRELIVNVQDEFEVFKPENPFIKINLNTNEKIICVEDNMRGIPVGKRDDGMNSLTAAFLIPHSGGKHEEGAYTSSVGINGEGNKVVCHTAEWLEVEVKRDNNIWFQRFVSDDEGAKAVEDVKSIGKYEGQTGTKITYRPDSKVYGDIFIDIEKLEKMLQELSYFTKGLKIILSIDGKEKVFFSKNGLIDGLKNPYASSAPFSYFYETDDCKVELALQWTTKKGSIKGYANGLYMPDGGAFISGFKSSLTRTFNSLSKRDFDGDTIRSVLDGFVSVKVKVGQFSNQAKTALANPEARTATSSAINLALKEFSKRRPDDFNKVVELLTINEKAERAAERARQSVLESDREIEDIKKTKAELMDKLSDCKYHDEKSSIYICEGDSAKGSFVKTRDSKYTAVMPIRGKIINALKHPTEEVLQNEEVKAIIRILGCGIFQKCNPAKLRYGKVYFAADADPDGYSIVCLLLTLFHELMPQLIEDGRIYWIQMPLYEVVYKDKTLFAYNDDELAKLPKGGKVNRNKGLGEMDPDSFEKAAFGSDARAIQFTMKDAEAAKEMLDLLLGNNNKERKDYVFKNINFAEVEE